MSKETVHIIDIPAKGLTAKEAHRIIEKENNVQVVGSRLEYVEREGGEKELVWAAVTKQAMPGDVSFPAEVEEVIPPAKGVMDETLEEEPFGEEEEGEGDLAAKVEDAIATLEQVADQLGGEEEEEGDDFFSDDEESDDSPFGKAPDKDDKDSPVLSYASLPKKAMPNKKMARLSARELPKHDEEFKGYKLADFRETKTHYIATYIRK